MSKPTDEELKTALRKAINMKENDQDPDFLAKSLLNHHYRLNYLLDLLFAADRYLNHGMADNEHRTLLMLLEKAKSAEEQVAKIEHYNFGLE
ncbi:MAG: hypothetical protein OEY29_00705 [Gammaproteobacteria bacterium]|nr:hypothetical protein [Gammaproteobacteria bacterium]